MPEVTYAVHTQNCSYLLDVEGVCHWIITKTGGVPPEVGQCIGAQFVACLDLTAEGGLAGELLLGAAALFAKQEAASGRMLLLRSGMILHVEYNGADGTLSFAPTPMAQIRANARAGDTTPPPPPYAIPALDAGEATVTLTMPLFRPESQVGRRLPPMPKPPPRTLRSEFEAPDTESEEARPTRRGRRSRPI